MQLLVHKGADIPQGAVNLSTKQAQLDIQLETAAGDPSYYPGNDHAYNLHICDRFHKTNVMNVHLIQCSPAMIVKGFTTVSLLTYGNLEDSTDGFFSGMKAQANQSFKMNSKVVTATVSNRNTSHLTEPVKLTFYHLKQVAYHLLYHLSLQENMTSIMGIISILFHRRMNTTTPVCSGIPRWMEGRGLLVAAVWWSPALNTPCVPATI